MKQRRNRSESNYKRAKINSWCRLLEKDFDWDYTFLLEIERKKIIEMYEYFKKCTRSDKMPIVARDLQLCIGLLDIVLEKDNLLLEFSGMKTIRRDDGMYEMVESPHVIACRNLYINTKNASRFCLFNFPTDDYDIEIIHKEELRRYKAWYLYNKRHYKIFCVNVKYGIQYGFRIFYLIALQNEENYEREESCRYHALYLLNSSL